LQVNLNAGLDSNSEIWENLLNQIQRTKRIKNLELYIDFNFDFLKKFSGNKQLLLVRIIQEFLNNSIKYSQCSKIDLMAKKGDNEILIIQLKDDGVGFDNKKIISGEGLKSMNHRAQLLEADIEIKSQTGLGTELNLTCKR
ncbi:MAG: sensor histidine kinase, partial [Bacteroidia bacterium]